MNSRTFHVWALVGTATVALSVANGALAASHSQPAGPASFGKALAIHYQAMVDEETYEKDEADVAHFTAKRDLSAGRTPPRPDAPDSRALSDVESNYARRTLTRIMAAYDKGEAEERPQLLADAQAGYDCFLQEAEEGYQLLHINRCRVMAETALATLEMPIVQPKPVVQPVAAAEPEPAEPPAPQDFTIYFGFDSALLGLPAQQTLDNIATAYAAYPDPVLVVVGHTDTSGPSDYNRRLSLRRAEAVAAALRQRGLASQVIQQNAMGEALPAVQTGDGVREPMNRRVVVTMSQQK